MGDAAGRPGAGAVIDADLRARAEAWRDDDPDPVTAARSTRSSPPATRPASAIASTRPLEFGTAGLRGALGAGPNRMNRVVVRRTAAALARWLDDHAVDRAGRGRSGRPPRLARVRRGHRRGRSPATGREVVLAASHRPDAAAGVRGDGARRAPPGSWSPPATTRREDNGYKVYAADGAQIVPPTDAEIAASIDAVRSCRRPRHGRARQSADPTAPRGRRRPVPRRASRGSGSALRRRSPVVAYTADARRGRRCCSRRVRGGRLRSTDRRCERRPSRTPTSRRSPSRTPRSPARWTCCWPWPMPTGADVALANDPDADRLAVAVPDRGGWRALTGDEIGVLLADHLLRHGVGYRSSRRDDGGVVVDARSAGRGARTSCSSRRSPASSGWLGQVWLAPTSASCSATRRRSGTRSATSSATRTASRPRSCSPSWCASSPRKGSSVPDRLDELAAELGVHVTRQVSARFEGLDGPAAMAAVVAGAPVAAPPARRAAVVIVAVEDLALGGRLPPTDAVILRGAGLRVDRPAVGHRAQAQDLRRGRSSAGDRRRSPTPAPSGGAAMDGRRRRRPRRCCPDGQAVPKRRSPASPRPGTMKASSFRCSSIEAVTRRATKPAGPRAARRPRARRGCRPR